MDPAKSHMHCFAELLSIRKLVGAGAATTVGVIAYNTERVPVTGRLRFNIVSPSTEAMISKQM